MKIELLSQSVLTWLTLFQIQAGGGNDVISPNNRDRHRTGKDVSGGMGGKNNAAWSGPVSTRERMKRTVRIILVAARVQKIKIDIEFWVF